MLVYSGKHNQWKGERNNSVSHPMDIKKLWEATEQAANGHDKHVSPVVDPVPNNLLKLPITRMQFMAIFGLNYLLDAVKTAVEAIPDTNTQAAVSSKFEEIDGHHREDTLFTTLGTALGISSEKIDVIWLQALEIE